MDEALQFLKRDIEVVFHAYSARVLKSLSVNDMVESASQEDVSQTQKFWCNEDNLKQIDNIVESYFSMLRNDCPTFSLGFTQVETDQQVAYRFDGVRPSQDADESSDVSFFFV